MKNIISLYHRFDQLFGLILVEKGLFRSQKCILIASLIYIYISGYSKELSQQNKRKKTIKGHTSEQIKEMQP